MNKQDMQNLNEAYDQINQGKVNTSPQGPTSVHQPISPREYYDTVNYLLDDPSLGTFLYRASKQLRKVKPEELNSAIKSLISAIEDKLIPKSDIGNEPSVGVDGM